MELLKTVKRRTFWSELVYYVLNIGLAAALLVIAQAFQTPFPALALVVLIVRVFGGQTFRLTWLT